MLILLLFLHSLHKCVGIFCLHVYVHRLGELLEVLKEMEKEEKSNCDSDSNTEKESGGLSPGGTVINSHSR